MKRFSFFIMMYLLASFGAGAQGFTIKGTVVDQDGKPVAGAKVSFEGRASVLATTTDEEGLWQMTIEERSSQEVRFKVEADDYPSYVITAPFLNGAMSNINVELFNTLIYKAGEQSTIFLMEAPDPSWGRYYRLDRVDGSKLIFERELTPTGATPYIFFANEDLRIDLRGRAKQGAGRAFSIDNISFTGSLNVWEEVEYTGTMCWLIPDHSISMRQDPFPMYVYPMHAVLYWLRSDYPYFPDEVSLVFHDAESTNYHPFVEAGKLWRVHGFNMGSAHTVTDYYFANEDEAETIDGHTYLKMYAKTGEETTLVGLFREENQRVYLYKKDAGREFLTYDFSLEEGDRFSPEYGDYSLCEVKEVSYKEVNGERLKVITFEANDRQIDAAVRTQVEWIEGIGHSGGSDPSPLAGLYSKNTPPNSWSYYTAYVLYDNTQDNNYYLPLTFGVPYNGWWGQQPLNTVKMLSYDNSDPELHYELVPDPAHDCYQLHVYGNAIMNCGPNHYAYCIRENGNKLRIQIDDLEPLMDCTGPHHVELYFPFFLAEQNYTVVDERGEHPVTVKQEAQTAYRHFIEEGKVWKVGWFPYGMNPDEWDWDEAHTVGTYYFDGDTIVGNQQCKKMMCRYEYGARWGGIPSTEYEGALYELDRKVYLAYPNQETFVLLYDFAASEGNFIEFYDTEKQEETTAIIGTKKQSESEKFHGIETELYIKFQDSNQCVYMNYEVNWREGIGYNCLHNTEDVEGLGGSGRKFLMSCYIGDEVLYYDSTLKDGTITDSEVKKNWLDFTHTVKTKPKAPRRGEVAASDEETVTGEYSIKELFVNFKTLMGPYTITVLDAAGQPIYNKVVQTSNVVALNTDISIYPKGSYTITIENENEVYSAEFKTGDEDGLSPTPSPVRQGSIYNLKGQRLTQPQRGVNIINGRKVVVK